MGFFTRKKETEEKKTGAKPAGAGVAKKAKSTVKGEPKKTSMKDLYGGEAKTAVKTADKTDIKAAATEKKITGQAYRRLIKPLITEKAANLGAQNKYVFAVAMKANKIEIAKAVSEVYGIKPVSVNIIMVRGKKVRYGRIQGERKSWKKAIVMLPAGKSINIYEGV